MKKILLIAFSFSLLGLVANAQPANDECTTAQPIGNLPTPAACPSGIGAQLNIPGTLVGATEANPYVYMNGCSGAGGPNMAVPANDVWYTFTATGYQMELTITSTFANPNVAMYSGTCAALGGGVGGCAVGTGGTVSLTVDQMVPGTTYYLQISGNTGQTGTFNLQIQNNIDCNDCLNSSNLVVNPLPVNGSYQPGQVVNFCYTVDEWSEQNTNWFHGVQISFGAGWTGLTNPVPAATVQAGGGNWIYYPAGVTSTATLLNLGPGFYFNTGVPDAGNNFGDQCGIPVSSIPCPAGVSWTFCWDLTVDPNCSPGSDLSVTIGTSGDGESGSWNNLGCANDPNYQFNAVGACCPPVMSSIDITCPGANDGQATATPDGILPNYDYQWDGPGGYSSNSTNQPGANTISGLTTPGVYTVTITDNINCQQTATVTVNVGPDPAPVANNTGPYCDGDNISLSTDAGYANYAWTGPLAFTSALQNPTIAASTPANSGIYTVVVTNAAGCTGSATTNVTVNALPVANANNTGPYCEGETINLSSSGGTGYSWNGPGGYTSALQNPTIAASTTANSGVYTVTVTDANGCTSTATTNVTVNANPAPVAGNTGPYCDGEDIDLNSTGGFASYSWTGPGGFTSANQNPQILGGTPANSGNYIVTVTHANGCTATASTNVTVNALPVAVANNGGPYCAGQTIDLTSGGGTSYSWVGPNAFASALQNPSIASSTTAMAGIYTVTVTDANGCTSTATTNVVVNTSIVVNANNTGPYCDGATIQLSTDPGATYNWVGPGGFNSAVQNPTIPGATGANAGTYTVTVTNAAGCSGTATTDVIVNPNLVFVAGSNSPLCVGDQLDLNAQLIAGATYDWVGPNGFTALNTQNPSIASVTVLATGTYTVTATDASGCTGSATTVVIVNSLPVPVAGNNGPVCEGTSIDLTSNGGIDFDWVGPGGYVQNDTQNPTISPIQLTGAGTYTVTVTDGNGCSATATTDVVVNAAPVPVAGNDGPKCEGDDINLNSAGGVTYSWSGPGGYSDPNQNPTIVGVNAGNSGVYTVTVTDAAGCTATATTTVGFNALPVANANTNTPICEGDDINLTSSGGVNYAWNGPGGYSSAVQNPTITSATSADNGTYTVTVTDANGCTGTATVDVTTFPNPTPAFTGDPLNGCVPFCVDLTDQSNVVGSTITQWLWNVEGQDPSTNQNETFCFTDPGSYDASLTVTTADGCSASITYNNYINGASNPEASFIFTPQEIIETDPEVIFASTSTGAVSWFWDFGDGSTSTQENPVYLYGDTGTFCITLTVTNAAGCTDTTLGCLYIRPDFALYYPNTFTVNDDGLNEIWKFYGRGVKSLEVWIFNRWGEEIFFFNDINKGWPGTRTNGEACKQDVYAFKAFVTDFGNDEHTIFGHINLIR